MDSVDRACEIAAAAMEWDWDPEYNGEHMIVPSPEHAIRPAIQALADAGLLADTECRSCSGTGGTDVGGARCAVCNGTGHRWALCDCPPDTRGDACNGNCKRRAAT